MFFSSKLSWYISSIPCMYEVYISFLKQTKLLASRKKEPTYRDLMSKSFSCCNVKKRKRFTCLEWITLIWLHEQIFAGRLRHGNSFLDKTPVLYPLKRPENQKLFGVFWGYKIRTLARNELIFVRNSLFPEIRFFPIKTVTMIIGWLPRWYFYQNLNTSFSSTLRLSQNGQNSSGVRLLEGNNLNMARTWTLAFWRKKQVPSTFSLK